MEIRDKVAVVTGAASGAGRAIALGLASRGAGGVVVSDVDAAGATAVAREIEAGGRRATAIPADVTREKDIQDLVTGSEAAFGPVDIFFSNAGIIVPGGPEVPDDAWSRIWAINVHSHVYVARALLPGVLARGSGALVITASAAGLLTQLGSAPYAVTKHAAVALAEWLAITYGDRGLAVSCLCPQAFTSNLFATSSRELGGLPLAADAAGGSAQAGSAQAGSAQAGSAQAAVDGVLTAEQVAAAALDGVEAGQFLILPHPEVATYEQRRAGDRERWLRGMRRLQARLTGS